MNKVPQYISKVGELIKFHLNFRQISFLKKTFKDEKKIKKRFNFFGTIIPYW